VRGLKHPVGEGAFSVIDVGNNAKIANVIAFHRVISVLYGRSIADRRPLENLCVKLDGSEDKCRVKMLMLIMDASRTDR
jgi:hypothetical protein